MALSNYVLTQIGRMATLTNTEMTDRHLKVLEYAYRYYEKNRVGPLFLNLKKNLGLGREELDRLFPHGLNSLYTWVGIPIQTVDETCKPPAQLEVTDYREVYLDHNATTYIRREVAQILHDYHEGRLGYANPSSGTKQGQEAFDMIDHCRSRFASLLGVEAREIFFTSCGSEGNNLAIKGTAFRYLEALAKGKKPHLVVSSIEHSSVLEPHRWLEGLGFDVTYVDPGSDGIVTADRIATSLKPQTILVSVMIVNNEIGTVSPVAEIGTLCRQRGIPFLVDAVQALGKIPLRPVEWGVSFMTFSGHKVYAPKGVGALYKSKDFDLVPIIHGGGQELGVRSGTENVGYIAAMTKAAEIAYQEMEKEQSRLRRLRDDFLIELQRIEPGVVVQGSLEHRSSANLSIAFPGVDTGSMLLSLNNIGICVSAGSACSTGRIKTSHVLEAIGADTKNYGTIRFSFGLRTSQEGLSYVLKYLPEILRQIKSP